MNHLKYSSIKLWCDDLANDSLLQYLIGSFDPPNSSHYDFIIRLTGFDPHLSDLAPQSFITKKKFKNKLAKGENLLISPKLTLLLFVINTETVQVRLFLVMVHAFMFTLPVTDIKFKMLLILTITIVSLHRIRILGGTVILLSIFSASLSTISLSTTRLYTLICLFLSLWKKHLDMML